VGVNYLACRTGVRHFQVDNELSIPQVVSSERGKRITVEPHYFELSGEIKNSSKWREFEIADSKLTEGQIQEKWFEFEITGVRKNRV